MEAATQQQEMKKCPACAELILADAMKCKHCGEYLNSSARPSGSEDFGTRVRPALLPVLGGTALLAVLSGISFALVTGYSLANFRDRYNDEVATYLNGQVQGQFGSLILAVAISLLLAAIVAPIITVAAGYRRDGLGYIKTVAVSAGLGVLYAYQAQKGLAIALAVVCVAMAIFIGGAANDPKRQALAGALGAVVAGVVFGWALEYHYVVPSDARAEWSSTRISTFAFLFTGTMTALMFLPAGIVGSWVLRKLTKAPHGS